MRKGRVQRNVTLALAVSGVCLTGSFVSAQVTSATPLVWYGNGIPGATGNYVDAFNWNPNQVPTNNTPNTFVEINDGGTAVINASDAAQGTFLTLGLNAANLPAPADSGTRVIHGGTLTVGELRDGGRDTLSFSSGTLSTTAVGGGTGTITQDGGDVFVNYQDPSNVEPPVQSLYVGDGGLATGNTGNGTYTISAGTVTVGVGHSDNAIFIGTGSGSTGAFAQSGATLTTSTVTSTAGLSVARAGGTGSYSISGGTLNVATIYTGGAVLIGNGSTGNTSFATGTVGTFTQTGGAVSIQTSGYMTVGSSGGSGSYSISAGTLGINNNGLFVGDAASGDGSVAIANTVGNFTQTGGAVTIPLTLEVGRRGGTGTYTMSAGTLSTGTELRIASNGGASATFVSEQSSIGTFTLSGTGAVTVGTNLNIGLSSSTVVNTTQGTLNMSGGSIGISAAAAIMAVGNGLGSSGTANISAGTLTMNGATAVVDIGRNGSNGLLDVSGTASVTVNELTLDSGTPGSSVSVLRELKVEGGTLNVGFWEQGGVTPPATVTRTVIVTGGNLNVTSATAAHRGGRLGNYTFSGGISSFAGNMPFDTSNVNVSNTASVSFANLRVQTATINITGGTVAATNINDASNEGGVVTLSGGNLNVSGTYNLTFNAPTVAGSLLINGGSLTAGTLNTSAVSTGTATSGTTLTESSGSLSAATINVQANSSFNYSGGSLTASTILTLASSSTMKTDNTLSLTGVANFNVGNATLNVNSGSLTIPNLFNNNNRTLTKTGSGTLTISGPQANAGAAPTITVSNGTLNLNSNANNGVVGAGLLVVNANSTTNFGSSQGLATINVGSGAVATATENPTPATTNKVINTTTVGTIAGKLDLTNNKLITTTAIGTVSGGIYTPGSILGLVQSGRAGGTWTGNGIVTSETNAASPHVLTTLGVATGADVKGISGATTATWAGQTITPTSTLVMYTYAGDSNLDGKIDADDYFNIDSNYNKPATATYSHGDFNYDGQINGDDYFIIDSNLTAQSTAFATGSAFDPGFSAGSLQAVPEPASITTLGFAGLSALRRRRRR